MSETASQVVGELVPTETNKPRTFNIASTETAKHLGKLSGESRRERKLLLAQFLRSEALNPTHLNHAPAPLVQQTVKQDSPELIRARAQLELANTRLDEALADDKTEPIDLERLTRSVNGISERVRVLAGIPLPGNRRPGPERVSRSHAISPLD